MMTMQITMRVLDKSDAPEKILPESLERWTRESEAPAQSTMHEDKLGAARAVIVGLLIEGAAVLACWLLWELWKAWR